MSQKPLQDLIDALESIVDCCDEDSHARDYASRQTEIRGIAKNALKDELERDKRYSNWPYKPLKQVQVEIDDASRMAVPERPYFSAYDMQQMEYQFTKDADARWERVIRAVMPADFKDWHENNSAERPYIVATVLENLREREELAYQLLEAVPLVSVTADDCSGTPLRPIGSTVFILHGRDDQAHPCKIVGYSVAPCVNGTKHSNRVFVQLLYLGCDKVGNERMLTDIWDSELEALASKDKGAW